MGKRKAPTWTHGPAYAALRGALTLPQVAGPRISIAAARRIGRAFGEMPFNRKRVQRAAKHLAVPFPDWDEQHRTELALLSYEHLCMLAAEIVFAPRLLTEENWFRHVEVQNMSPAVCALGSGRPSIMITAHCGNWEVLGYATALLGYPVHALYRPLDIKPLDNWVRTTRQRCGITLVDKFGAGEILPQLLDNNQSVAFVADQNAGDRGLFVPFLGRLASTYKTIGLLAVKYETPIVVVQGRRMGWHEHARNPDGSVSEPEPTEADRELELARLNDDVDDLGIRYRLDIADAFGPEDWADAHDPVYYITARYRRAIEHMVRRTPEQYLWMHRIWKSRPLHERKGKPFPPRLRAQLDALPWLDEHTVDGLVEQSGRDAAYLQEHNTDRLT